MPLSGFLRKPAAHGRAPMMTPPPGAIGRAGDCASPRSAPRQRAPRKAASVALPDGRGSGVGFAEERFCSARSDVQTRPPSRKTRTSAFAGCTDVDRADCEP